MRRYVPSFGTILFLTLAGTASAQQLSGSMGSIMTGAPGGSSGTTSSFFAQTMTKPSMSAMSSRPSIPTPLNFNIRNMLPTFPNLQNTMLLRNLFGGPQTVVQMPRQAPPPPQKKSPFGF